MELELSYTLENEQQFWDGEYFIIIIIIITVEYAELFL